MIKVLSVLLILCCLCGCSNVPSSQELETDISGLDKEIDTLNTKLSAQPESLLSVLGNVRLQVLLTTKSMLEQKRSGLNRFIAISYTVDGETYSPPANKKVLLEELDEDISKLEMELKDREKNSSQYTGGLLSILAMTTTATTRNTIAFLEQRRLLLKHDIPCYSLLPKTKKETGPGFKATPGKDIDKF